VPKRDMDLKLSFQRLGSAGTLVLYRMMAGRKFSTEFLY